MTQKTPKSPFFFFNTAITIICVFGIIGFAFSFMRYFNHTYYLPTIPNLYDSIFLIFSALYLGTNIIVKEIKENK